ncbi:MAG: hypothetical protein B1H08_05965, partial [Candidatus Omnitrophica bacterium 4484_171]
MVIFRFRNFRIEDMVVQIFAIGKSASGGKERLRRFNSAGALMRRCSGALLLFISFSAYSLPQGERVVAGQADFHRDSNTLTVNVHSDKMIANYNSFSIARPEAVRFNQPSSSSIALNRVVGIEPSSIMGTLTANGKIFLTNPNGILFGPNSRVDTAGLIASTLNISNDDFLSGRYTFYGKGASVVNQGRISAPGGYIVLLGSSVENTGVIEANLGSAALASGEAITLNLDPQGLISVVIDEAAACNLENKDSAVKNTGAISADGGKVILTAKVLNGVFDKAVNNSGIIEAKSLSERNGEIILEAQGAPVVNSGTLEATNIAVKLTDADMTNEKEGVIKAEKEITVTADNSKITNDGTIEGEKITAAAKNSEITNNGTIKGEEVAVNGEKTKFINTESGIIQARKVTVAIKGADAVNAGAIIASGNQEEPDGGDIAFTAENVYQKGIIMADAYNEGNAGEIEIISDASTTLDENSTTSAACPFAVGNGGRIYIDSLRGNTSVLHNALIDVSAGSVKGDAGFIEVSAYKQLGFFGILSGRAPPGYQGGKIILDPHESTVGPAIFGSGTTTTYWTEGDLTITGDISLGSNATLNIYADHKSEASNDWDDGTGAIINQNGAYTISTAEGAANTSLNLKAGSGIGTADQPIKTNIHTLSAEINSSSTNGDIYIEQGSNDLTITSITTPNGTVTITAGGSILDDLDESTLISASNINLTADGDIGGFNDTAETLEEKCAPMLDVALGNGVLTAAAGGNVYIAEHNASTLFTSKYSLTSTGTDKEIGLANLTPHRELAQTIVGVTLSTVPAGKTRTDLVLDLASVGGEEGVKLMAYAGIKTVRTYYPPSEDLLDAFAKYGI